MSWQTDVSVWTDKPDSIQVFSDDGQEQDYVPERTCRDEDGWCSECHKFLMNNGYAYCPHCGAKVVSE